MDDTVIMSDSFEQHLQDIHDVLGRLESSGLKLNANVPLLPINQYFFDMMYLGMPPALLQIVWTASKTFPFYPL